MPNREIDIILKFVADTTDIDGFNAAARKLEDHFEGVKKEIEATRREMERLKQTSEQLGQLSRQLFVVGTITTGGIFAAAAKYVKDAQVATDTTRAWKKAQDNLNKSGERFGEVAAQAVLPTLQKAAQVAEKAAGFVEEHPDLVKAAFNTGLVIATLGAVGMAVSKGIRIYADLQLLAGYAAEQKAAKQQAEAAAVMLAASENQLKAAGMNVPSSATSPTSGSGMLAGIGTAATIIVAGLIATGAAVALANQLFDKLGLNAKIDDARTAARDKNIKLYPGNINNPEERALQVQLNKAIDSNDTAEIERLKQAISDLGTTSEKTASKMGGLQDSGMLNQILKAYDSYKAEDLKLVQDHYRERNAIIADALQAERDANAQYAADVAKVNSSTSSALGKLATDFANANAQAEVKYAQDRAKIIADGAKEIEDIQKESQERLRKLAQEHNDRVADLTAARDALGLAKENRDYKRQVADEKRGTAEEIKERKRQTAERLADLKQSYDQERAQRLAEYIARQAEIKAQAAERLAELAAEHQEELKKIREQKAAKLKELDAEFNEERKRRYNQMIQQLKDLDAGLFQINKLEVSYMNARVAEIQAIIDRANAAAAAAPGKATGGYAWFGKYTLGEQGREYVMTNRTTQAAEAIIGGSLTQDRLLGAIARGGQTVNYSGRFSGEYTASMRRQVRSDVNRAIGDALAGV